MASEPTRIRFRADGPDAYADALLRLIRHARVTKDDFSFGPIRLADCERDGLTLQGPDLRFPLQILALVPGLAQVDH